MMIMEQETWRQCQREIISLIEQIDVSFDQTARKRLTFILYGEGDYVRDVVDQALKTMNPKLLFKLDSLERSMFCGP